MADTLGTAQSDWTDEGTTTNDSPVPLDQWTFFDTSSIPPDPYQLVLPVTNTLALMFYGEPDGADDRVIDIQFWAVNDFPSVSGFKVGVWLGSVRADLGSTSSADLESDTLFFSDIVVIDDRSLSPPGMRVIAADPRSDTGTPGKGAAILMFDTIGAERIFIQITCDSGIAKAGLCWRAF